MKKKQLKVLHWLNTGIFPAYIMFSSGFNYDEIIKMLKQKKADEWLLGIDGYEELIRESNYLAIKTNTQSKTKGESKSLLYIFVMNGFDFTDDAYCYLAHEVLHICQFFLPDVLRRDKENEAEAYLHTHIMQQCLKILRGNAK